MIFTLMGVCFIVFGAYKLQPYLELVGDGIRTPGTLIQPNQESEAQECPPVFLFSLDEQEFRLPYPFLPQFSHLKTDGKIPGNNPLFQWFLDLCPELVEGERYLLMVEEEHPEHFCLLSDYRVPLWEGRWTILGALFLLVGLLGLG